MTYELCVARFDEDLEWLGPYKKQAVIYNKGSELNKKCFKEVFKISPIGLETFSFMNYIVDHYSNLPDVVVFLQGRIDDHLGDIKNKHSENNKKDPLVFIDYVIKEAQEKGISSPLDETVYDHYGWRLATPDRIKNKECKVCDYKNITDWWENYIGFKWPGPQRCAWSQNFAVRKDNILKHPKELYVHIINDPEFQQPYVEVSHFWERMLFPFFGVDLKKL